MGNQAKDRGCTNLVTGTLWGEWKLSPGNSTSQGMPGLSASESGKNVSKNENSLAPSMTFRIRISGSKAQHCQPPSQDMPMPRVIESGKDKWHRQHSEAISPKQSFPPP